VDPRVHVILDVKTPGSGEAEANDWSNLERLRPTDEVKFIVCDRPDFDWSVNVVRHYGLTDRCPVLFAPSFGRVAPVDLATWILDSGLPIRLQLQLHKLLWDPKQRGV
jgi:7-carboxy-7-deazaguanine synthase